MPEAIPPHVAHFTGRKLPHRFGGVRCSLMCQGGYGRYSLPPLSANSGMASVAQPSISQHQQVLEKLLLLIVANLAFHIFLNYASRDCVVALVNSQSAPSLCLKICSFSGGQTIIEIIE